MKKLTLLITLILCGIAAYGQERLVVAPIENRGSKLDAAVLNNLQDNLMNAFINSGRFQVVDRNALSLLAGEQKFQMSDWADDKKSAEMGKVLNANYLVRTIATYDGEVNVLTARILDVNTADGLAAGEMEFTTQRNARGRMYDFVSNIVQRIGRRAASGQQKERLVVTPFENRGSKLDKAALDNLQDYLINAFINTGRFQVPDRNALALLAGEQKFQMSDWADEKKSAEMGKVLNANYIVRVIAMHDGEVNVLTVRILDVNKASGLSAGEMGFTTQHDAHGKMEAFSGRIVQRISGNVTTQAAPASTPVPAQITSTSRYATPQPSSIKYKVGNRGPAGGWVFYDKGKYTDGWRYLEAAFADLANAEWGLYGTNVATGTKLGSGKENTRLIVEALQRNSESGKAAQLCRIYVSNGYADWFLPSKDELDLMYKNLKKKGIGGLSNTWYWSSSQYSISWAWEQDFNTGKQSGYIKYGPVSVRAIRAF